MPKENRYDSINLTPPARPYDERFSIYDDSPVMQGQNYYVHYSGALKKFPGIPQWSPLLTHYKPKKLWLYETLPSSSGHQYSWLLMSAFNTSTSKYELLYKNIDTYSAGAAFAAVTAYRDVNASTQIHNVTFSKGLAYVKTFPASGSSERLGTVVLDGSTGSIVVKPWGLLGPTSPAMLSGKNTLLTVAVDSAGTSLTVASTTGFPGGTFYIHVGYEIMSATVSGGTTFTVTRAQLGTSAQAHDVGEVILYFDWTGSDHKLDVNRGWLYSYAYKSITGQISNRADIQRNPDLMPSFTGPFFDAIPKMTITGTADTTNVPTIVIYRTTDGGGTFFKLEEITNTGAGSITYEDKSFGTGASSTTKHDPIPDSQIDTATIATSLTSNSPPPTVLPPLVVGTDTPDINAFAIENYASRIWFSIQHYLFYSSRDELRDGIGEEAFVSGNFGSFFIFNDPICGLGATSDALYIFTTEDVIKLTGTNKDTFSTVRIARVGTSIGQSVTQTYRNTVAFITKENQAAILQNDTVRILSDPLPTSFSTYTPLDDIMYYRDFSYELLIFGVNNGDAATAGQGDWFIYDLKRSEALGVDFWWGRLQTNSSCMGSFQSRYSDAIGMFSGQWNSTGDKSILCKATLPSGTISTSPSMTRSSVSASGTVTNLTGGDVTLQFTGIHNPPGNHLNQDNIPMRDSKLVGILIMINYDDGTLFSLPRVLVYFDNQTSAINPSENPPPRIQYNNTNGLETTRINFYPLGRNNYHSRITINLSDTTKDFSLLGFIPTYDPQYGAS